MKNIAIVGSFACSYDIFSRLKAYDKSINIFKITPSNLSALALSDIVILNKFNEKINLHHISPSSSVIVNSDLFSKQSPCVITASRLITTGYSPKSTLTVSSVSISEINSVLCCLQRSITVVESGCAQEEFMIQTRLKNVSILLTAVAAALCLNIDKDSIQKIFK